MGLDVSKHTTNKGTDQPSPISAFAINALWNVK